VLCSDRAEEFTTNKLFPDHVVYNHNSILIEYTHPGIELSDLIYEKLSQSNYDISLILLKNHGIIALGKDIDTCIIITEMCEKAAQIYVNAHTLSTPVFLTKEQIKLIQDDEHEKYRQSLYQ
jgi:ribulose-5-phosphate 4-epimerase/fuculose-1-phosphate aldolase